MTRQEFLDTLRKALNRELNASEVQDNIQYYDDYIRGQMARGLSEEQVTAQLGDPRLIARTILQVDEQRAAASTRENIYYEDESIYNEGAGDAYQDASEERLGRGFRLRSYEVKPWKLILLLLVILMIIFAILGAAVAIFWKLLPVILVISAVVWIYNRFVR